MKIYFVDEKMAINKTWLIKFELKLLQEVLKYQNIAI